MLIYNILQHNIQNREKLGQNLEFNIFHKLQPVIKLNWVYIYMVFINFAIS